MSGKQPSQIDQVVQGLRGLRLQGKSLQALEPGNQALAQFPTEPGLVAELVRILVALGQGQVAARLLGSLEPAKQQEAGIEPEVLARLGLVLGDRDRGADGCAPVAGGWLDGFLETGEDAPRSPRWQRLELKVQGGAAGFSLEGACGYCGHTTWTNLPVSLLVDRQELCPACFGKVRIFWGDIEEFLEEQHGDLLDLDTSQTDWDLLDAVRQRTQPGSEAPDVIRNLGQEYHFLLNEILMGLMLTGNGPARGGAE